VVVRREVALKKDQYLLDGKCVTKTEVATMLESVGLSRSNPTHIVPQGRVTALTTMRDEQRLETEETEVQPDKDETMVQLAPDALLGMVMHGMDELSDDTTAAQQLTMSWQDTLERSRKLEGTAIAARDAAGEGFNSADDSAGQKEKLEDMLKKKGRHSKLFEGIDYEKVKPEKATTQHVKGDSETKISELWQEKRDKEIEGKKKGRQASIEMQGFGKVGEVPESLVVEVNGILDLVRKPQNCFGHFNSERAPQYSSGGSGRDTMKLVAADWKVMEDVDKRVYEEKAAKDKNRYLNEIASIINQYGKATVEPKYKQSSRQRAEFEHRSTCYGCTRLTSEETGPLLECKRCPVALHLKCLPIGAKVARCLTKLDSCGHHQCMVCQKSASGCGGAVLCCASCPKAYCLEHRPSGCEITRKCEWAEQLEYEVKSMCIFFECRNCDDRMLDEKTIIMAEKAIADKEAKAKADELHRESAAQRAADNKAKRAIADKEAKAKAEGAAPAAPKRSSTPPVGGGSRAASRRGSVQPSTSTPVEDEDLFTY